MNLDVLTDTQIDQILTNPEVLKNRNKLDSNSKVYFNIELDDAVKKTIKDKLGLDLSNVKDVPMRWIKGDTKPHVDSGRESFQNSYLIFLHDNQGEFIIDNTSYPIQRGSGFVFSESLYHETRNTGSAPRLLIGPMSETGFPVGISVTFYYPTQADALANTNELIPGGVGSYNVITVSGISSWRLASNSTGPSSQAVVYNTGDLLIGDYTTFFYYLYPAYPCFLEGSTILCISDEKEVYLPIQNIKPGTLVKTSENGYKKVELIGTSKISNPKNNNRDENRLYICRREKYPELTEDLIITGQHCILVNNLSSIQREKILKSLGRIYITGKKYRLPAFADERAEPWISEGNFNVWHLALENNNIYNNYGVFANGGLLVETTSIRFMRDLSNMKIIS